MHTALRRQPHAAHRVLPIGTAPRRSPIPRRVLTEQLLGRTSWIVRKPGAMWNAVPPPSRVDPVF